MILYHGRVPDAKGRAGGGGWGAGGAEGAADHGGRADVPNQKRGAPEKGRKNAPRGGACTGCCRAYGAAGAWSKVPRVPMSPISKGVVW